MSGLYEYIKMAVQNIRANKGRSFLTMLGIISVLPLLSRSFPSVREPRIR